METTGSGTPLRYDAAMRRSQLVGLLLWRSGVLLVGSYGAIQLARIAWEYWVLPPQLEWGLTFVVVGIFLVGGSIVAEAVVSRREEGTLEP